jgi:hypothetical protein
VPKRGEKGSRGNDRWTTTNGQRVYIDGDGNRNTGSSAYGKWQKAQNNLATGGGGKAKAKAKGAKAATGGGRAQPAAAPSWPPQPIAAADAAAEAAAISAATRRPKK